MKRIEDGLIAINKAAATTRMVLSSKMSFKNEIIAWVQHIKIYQEGVSWNADGIIRATAENPINCLKATDKIH